MGLQKKSFLLYYSGGEIWVEHLDGLYGYTDLAIEKFEKDYIECKRPSLPALIAINLDETDVDEKLLNVLSERLLHGEKRFTKVVFVGANRSVKNKINHLFEEASFVYNFINDFEKAKEWLIN